MRRLGLGVLIELALSFAPVQPSAGDMAAILRDIVNGTIAIGLGDPILLWFAPGSVSSSGSACVVDPHGAHRQQGRLIREVFVDPAAVPGIWWVGHAVGPDERLVRSRVDDVCRSASSPCSANSIQSDGEFRDRLAQHLDVAAPQGAVSTPTDEPKEPEPPTPSAATSQALTEEHVSPMPEQGSPPREPSVAHPVEPQPLRCMIGWTAPTSRWSFVGHLDKSAERVALDLDHPKTVGIFGYMGSGKSYLLGTLIEAAVMPIPNINVLPTPLAVVVFNYRRNASDRFELGSLAEPNRDETDVRRLRAEFGASPQRVPDIHVLALPGELTMERLAEYGGASSSELLFNAGNLTVEDWELLMGEPGSEAVFARTIRHALIELRSARGGLTLDQIEHHVSGRLAGQSRSAAQLRFDFVRQYLSADRGIDFEDTLRPGPVLVVDLRRPLFNKSDALRFVLVCANQVSRVQGKFNKLVVFDEAHEYLSEEFGERIEARIRQMRHEGTSYAFATQDVGAIPLAIRRFITTRFVFSLGTRENADDLSRFAPEYKGYDLLGMPAGSCLVQANLSIEKLFDRPRVVSIRPRVTQHGGATRIFSH